MGQAKNEERRIKDLTLAQLRAEIEAHDTSEAVTKALDESVVPWLEANLAPLVDKMVRARIADYHAYLAGRGVFTEPPAKQGSGLWVPS